MQLYTNVEFIAFFLIYSLIGWLAEVCIMSIKERKFCNRGFFNAPFCMSYGVIFDLLIMVLPTLKNHFILQFLATLVTASAVEYLAGITVRVILGKSLWQYDRNNIFGGEKKGIAYSLAISSVILLAVKVLHPILYLLLQLIPDIILFAGCLGTVILLLLDFVTILFAAHKKTASTEIGLLEKAAKKRKAALGNKISSLIWNRIQKAYPDMETGTETELVFAKGVCLDKVAWIFFICALCGDLIETVYCRYTAGIWMSRSSVVYGPFSIVWGIGAVILTVILQKLKTKEDRYIFTAGFFLGGVYEYLCSVFTEVFFGTVFWDYSKLPFNIGGRTNLLFCVFWGVLSVVWVKVCYPRLSRLIEKIPALAGKILTWGMLLFLFCDILLSVMVLNRYMERREGREKGTIIEAFIDNQYPDDFVEEIWPNMKIR